MALLNIAGKGFEIVACVLVTVCFMRGFMAHVRKACDRVIAFGEKTVLDLFAVLVQIAMFLTTIYWFQRHTEFTLRSTSIFSACVMGVYLVTFGFLAYADNLLDLAIYHFRVKNSPEFLAAVAAAKASGDRAEGDT
jgi:hypothetical protein